MYLTCVANICRSTVALTIYGRYYSLLVAVCVLRLKKENGPVSDNEPAVLLESDLTGVELIARGKVRDVYQAGEGILFIATDRISAFDVVLPNGIPRKGEVLTKLSIFWFDFLKDDFESSILQH